MSQPTTPNPETHAQNAGQAPANNAGSDAGVFAVIAEMSIAEAFFSRANRRIRGNFKAIDRNDDDYMKLIAAKAYELGGYPFDAV